MRWLWLASPAAQILWDDQSWDLLSTRHVQLARDADALGVLPEGADGFAERAARELLATGERVRKRIADAQDGSPPGRPRSPGWPPTACPTLTRPSCS